MSNINARMKLWEDLLSMIDYKRAETGDDELGSAIEKVILDTQFQDLEQDILDSPGAIEPWLVRRNP